jgi:hypothetical protein
VTETIEARDSDGVIGRLSRSLADIDRRRLQERFAGVAITPIATVTPRVPARFGGEIREQKRSAPGSPPTLKVTVDDGTGTAIAVFTGRARIRGVDAGRAMLLEGVARREGTRLVVMNPAYTLLP